MSPLLRTRSNHLSPYTQMRNNTGHIGYSYQIRCALLHILREFAQKTGVVTFRMEHENGDDFDFEYKDKLNVFQTKDEVTPDIPTHLVKMWRRSTEKIYPFTTSSVHLAFIFSRDHSSKKWYGALVNKKITGDKLKTIKDKINAEVKTEIKVKSEEELRAFLDPIAISVLSDNQIESETLEKLRLLTFGSELTDSQITPIIHQYYGQLLKIMTTSRKVPFNELREVLLDWLAQQALGSSRLHAKFRPVYDNRESNTSAYKLSEPSITESGVLP